MQRIDSHVAFFAVLPQISDGGLRNWIHSTVYGTVLTFESQKHQYGRWEGWTAAHSAAALLSLVLLLPTVQPRPLDLI